MPGNGDNGPDNVPGRRISSDHTAPPSRGLPHDDRPSIRIALASALLRHGHDPLRVAESTHVPLALVELLAEHSPARGRAPTKPSCRHLEPPRPWASPPGQLPTRGGTERWFTTITPLLMNLTLALTCAATHHPILAATTLLSIAPPLAWAVLTLTLRR